MGNHIKTVVAVLVLGCACFGLDVRPFSQAIARAEGFYIRGSVANRTNNPGDIRTNNPHAYPGQVGVYHGYAEFSDAKWGWRALDRLVMRAVMNTSKVYNSGMTIIQMGKLYAGNWSNWSTNVAHYLGVPATTTLAEYFGKDIDAETVRGDS